MLRKGPAEEAGYVVWEPARFVSPSTVNPHRCILQREPGQLDRKEECLDAVSAESAIALATAEARDFKRRKPRPAAVSAAVDRTAP